VACPALTLRRKRLADASCPVDCHLTSWTGWSSCDVSCGGGLQIRSRQVLDQGAFGGLACATNLTDTQGCASEDCPVDCKVGDWDVWTACSETCGNGIYQRSRTLTPPQQGGALCPESIQTESCFTVPCPVHCEHEWLDWTSCSKSCGTGIQRRPVNVTLHAAHGGLECPDAQERTCNTEACPTPAPTPAPSAFPTHSPTPAPTSTPTMSPTFKSRPTINIVGGNVITLENTFSGQLYEDQGATCSDLTDGDLTHKITVNGTIDLTQPRSSEQIITYSCENAEGAVQYDQRYVYVVFAACPTCKLLGPETTTVEASFPFSDPGINCTDNFPTAQLQFSQQSDLDVEKEGTYHVTYFASDRAGNTNTMCGDAAIVRTVVVKDTMEPVIGLKYHALDLTDASKKTAVGLMAEHSIWMSHKAMGLAIGCFACGVALIAASLRQSRSQPSHSVEEAQMLV